VGHLNLGAGRVVYQEYTRVSRSIKTGSFFTNHTLVDAVELARENDKAVHILGLLSPGGVHSHENHIHAMVELAVRRGAGKVYLHAFLDGRDTPPQSAEASLRWPLRLHHRPLLRHGSGSSLAAHREGLRSHHPGRGRIHRARRPDRPAAGLRSGRDGRQITRPFIEPDFDCFERKVWPRLGRFVSLTEYNSQYDIPVAYPPERLKNVFGEYVSGLGMHQLRIAETEKYAHVTFFFNGGREEPFEFEDRILIDSPDVATYDLQPEMSAGEVTDKLVEAIESDRYEVIIVNYANPDMVGHTGNYEATVQAIEYLDGCLGRLVEAVQKQGGDGRSRQRRTDARSRYRPAPHRPHQQPGAAHLCGPAAGTETQRRRPVRHRPDHAGADGPAPAGGNERPQPHRSRRGRQRTGRQRHPPGRLIRRPFGGMMTAIVFRPKSLLLVLLLAGLLPAGAQALSEAERQAKARELERLQQRLEALRQERDAVRTRFDRDQRALRDVERRIGRTVRELKRLEKQLRRQRSKLARLRPARSGPPG